MTKKGREFNEIYDLTAMRVIVDSVKDCYGAIGVIHSLWKPLPGRFKDWVAMPKFNMYRALHTTVIGPEGRPLEIQIRTMEMHRTAEFGVAAHWIYKEDGSKPVEEKVEWLRHLLDWQQEMADPQEFAQTLKADLFEDEVFVFTPKGEVKSLGAGATPLDFAYEIHTDVGHRCVGAKVNGKIVPLHYTLQSGDICEVLTSKKERGPSRDWLALAKTTRAQSKIRAWFKRERREDSERSGREILQENLKRAGLPPQKIHGSPLLADVIREMGFKKGEDFYIALGQSKISAKTVTQKLMHRLKEGESAVDEPSPAAELMERRETPRKTAASSTYGIKVEGVKDVMLRLAKCCRPVPGDPIVGYISLGKGITIHNEHCPNAQALMKNPERFTPVSWDGDTTSAFRVELQVDGWDRHRLLEDLSRTFAETGINILEARCTVVHPMVKNRFVVEVGDTEALRSCITQEGVGFFFFFFFFFFFGFWLLHDTVEDTSASLEEVTEEFGEEIGQLVDGLTKLSGVTFQSRDDRQAENYRKMMVAMARDIRVILIKLADRLHNMRTLGSMPKSKQQEKAARRFDLRPARAPARHPRDQVGARGPRLPDAPPAQVQRDQAARLAAARGARRLCRARRRVPGEGAEGGRHRGRHLRARQALSRSTRR